MTGMALLANAAGDWHWAGLPLLVDVEFVSTPAHLASFEGCIVTYFIFISIK
jgi:hypothetical protein